MDRGGGDPRVSMFGKSVFVTSFALASADSS
jgi:hypothetical protein